MSNEHTQDEENGYTDTFLEPDSSASTQNLVLNAYLEEKKRWEDDIKLTTELLASSIKEQIELENKILKQSKLIKFVNGKLNRKSKQEKRLIQVSGEIEKLKSKFARTSNSPPSPDAYELAIFGSLFKAR